MNPGLIAIALLVISPFSVWPQEAVTPEARRHPGHKMEASFNPSQETFSTDGPVLVTLKIKNIGDTPFKFMRGGRQRGPRDNQFAYTAEQNNRMLPDVGEPTNFGGIGSYVVLAPNEEVEISVDLTKWFDFKEPGLVMLRGSYYMYFGYPDLTGYTKIWEDFACAEFSIKIK